MEVLVERCAALDVHKDTVMACVRRPGEKGRRGQEVREFRTFTSSLRGLRDWLLAEGVTQVAMEATGVYWRPVWDVLEPTGMELLLCNAHHVKNLPGRKTDVADSAWLAQLLECGLLRGSFVPPEGINRLRDLTRYRKKLIEERTREIQRVQKLLETAGIKLDSVVSDVMGKSAREMLDALIAGVDDVDAMADMAKTRMRPKIPELRLALEGRFSGHHALMLRMHLDHIDQLAVSVSRLDGEVEREIAPFAEQVRRLCTMPGVGPRTAQVVIAEIGVDMTRFPSAEHLASWAGLCPGNAESAGKRRTGKARKGDQALRNALCEAAWSAVRVKDSYFQAQFRRFCRRFGTRNEAKAIFAVAHSMLKVMWHLLAAEPEPGTGEIISYIDLGGDWFDKRNEAADRTRRLVRQLEQLGHKVQLSPAA